MDSVGVSELQVVPEQDETTEEMFGSRSGYLHPYVSLRGEYTDNLYNVNFDEKSSYLTIFSPGIWFGMPRSKETPARISLSNTAVGGTRYSLPASGSFDRFQAYLLAGLDYKNYSADADLNYTAWNLEGTIQYNLPAGLSFRIMDRFTLDQDRFDIGSFLPEDLSADEERITVADSPSRIRKYASNRADIAFNFDMGEKFSSLLDFTHFYLDYEEAENGWLDRTDNRLSLTLSYQYSPKTSYFVEYAKALVEYDFDNSFDSDNMYMYGGISWRGSVKTSLRVKGGYQMRDYDTGDQDDADTFTMETWFNYLVTDKTKMSLYLYKALEETDTLASSGRDATVVRFRYDQQFSYRIKGFCEFWYEDHDYSGFTRVPAGSTEVDARQDTFFRVRPAVQYFFGDWLMAELAYSFENRDSNDNYYDFTTQTLFLSLNASF